MKRLALAAICLLLMPLAVLAADAQTTDLISRLDELVKADPIARIGFYLGAGLLGMVLHYVKKWADNDISGGLFDYFRENPRRTVLALFAFAGVAGGELGTSLLGGMGVVAVTIMGLKSGWLTDTLNKGKAPDSALTPITPGPKP